MQRRSGGGRYVGHLVVGMEGGEVQRHLGPEPVGDPPRQRLQLGRAVVQTGDQQRRDLQPAIRFVVQVLQRVQHRGQMRSGLLEVEVLGESLQVHVGRIHLGVELAPRLGVNVARRDCDRAQPDLVTGIGGVHRVFGEDHRIVVGERHAHASMVSRQLRDLSARGRIGQPVHLAAFRDVPVLAELAGEVAAGGAEREHARARKEVIQRLFLDRVDAEARAATVCRQRHRIAGASAHEAHAALTFVQTAVARAQVALDAAVLEPVPPARRVPGAAGAFLCAHHGGSNAKAP